jgi:hypothetical protein
MGFAGFPVSPSSPTEDGSDEVTIPTSAPPSEGLLLVGSRSPSLGSAPFLAVHPETVATARWTNPRGRSEVTPFTRRGLNEPARCMTGRNFLLPSPHAWALFSAHAVLVLFLRRARLKADARELPLGAGLPLANGHQHSNWVAPDQMVEKTAGPPQMCTYVQARDLPALPVHRRRSRTGIPLPHS